MSNIDAINTDYYLRTRGIEPPKPLWEMSLQELMDYRDELQKAFDAGRNLFTLSKQEAGATLLRIPRPLSSQIPLSHKGSG